MDIDLLSKIVKELILDNDEVALPGVGSFVAEYVPATFSDRGFTINPPYKRLSFRNKISESGAGLVDFYAKCNRLDADTASKILTEFLSELRNVLESKKVVIFPGLGKLRATKENYFFFVADEDLDIYPEGFGLEPVSLKTHEESPAEVSATMSALRSILNPEESAEEAEAPSPATDDVADSVVETVADVTDDAVSDAVEESATKETLAAVDATGGVSANVAVSDTEVMGGVSTKITTDTDEKPLSQPSDLVEKPETTDGDAVAESEVGIKVESQAESSTPPTNTEFEKPEPQAVENPQKASPVESSAEPQTTAGPADAEPVNAVSDVKLSDKESSAVKSSKKNVGWKVLLWIMVALIALAITALVAFVVLAHTAPDFIDSILYTPEELDILNWPLSDPE